MPGETANDRSSPAPRTLRAGSVELCVVDQGRGTPILLVHGFPLDHSMWDHQIERFSQRWRVIAPDLRGFGRSQVTPGVATMEQMADDLAALLDALDVREPVVLCGLSMGGYVAFQFWRKYAARLRALVLCDTRAAPDTSEAAAQRLKTVEHVLASGTQYLVDTMLPKLYAAATIRRDPGAIRRQTILDTAPEGAAAALRGMAERPDVRPLLPRIQLPALVVVGQEDAISGVDEMRAIAQAIPGAQFSIIPESGHMTPLENPGAFNAAVEQFVEQFLAGLAKGS